MDNRFTSLRESPWTQRLCLAGVLGLALWPRLLAIQWGLPLKYAHIDESVVIHYSLRIVAGALNPGFYDYPNFFLYLLAGSIRLGSLLHGLFGSGLEELLGAYIAGDAGFFTLSARGLTVAFALATVALTYSFGRRRAGGAVGFGAAVLLAVNALHVRHSHYGTIDVAAGFFTLWAMDRIVEFGGTRKVRDGALAAFAVGLATATKYYPAVLFLPLALLPFAGKHPSPFQRSAVLSLSAFTGLFVGSPFTVLSAGDFIARFKHLAPKIVGIPGRSVFHFQTLFNLWNNAGALALLSGLVGLALALRTKGGWRLLGVLWLTLFIFLGGWVLQVPHYGLALYPPLFLFAMFAADQLPWRRPWPVVLLTIVLFGASLPSTVREVRYLRRPDTRLQAAQWVRESLPPGSRILRFSRTPDFKRDDPFQISVDFTDRRLDWVGLDSEAQENGIRSLRGFDYLLLSGSPSDSAAVALFDRSFVLMKRFADPAASGHHNPIVNVYSTGNRPPLATSQ